MYANQFIKESLEKIKNKQTTTDDIHKQCMIEIELLTKFYNEMRKKELSNQSYSWDNHFC